MHLSVAEGVQGEQAHEGHGAAPALLAVTHPECRERPLCWGPGAPGSATRVGAASTSEACVILDLCKNRAQRDKKSILEHNRVQNQPASPLQSLNSV